MTGMGESGPEETYRPLRPKARLPVLLFWLVVGACLVGAAAHVNLAAVAGNLADGLFVSEVDAQSADSFAEVAGMLFTVTLAGAMITMILWFRAAYGNVRALGGELKYKPSWAVWGWIIPVVSLFMPKRLADEIAASIRAERNDSGLTPRNVGIWWVLVVLAALATAAAVYFRVQANSASGTPDDLRMFAWVALGACLLGIFAAMAFTKFIRTVTSEMPSPGEAERQAAIRAQEAPAGPDPYFDQAIPSPYRPGRSGPALGGLGATGVAAGVAAVVGSGGEESPAEGQAPPIVVPGEELPSAETPGDEPGSEPHADPDAVPYAPPLPGHDVPPAVEPEPPVYQPAPVEPPVEAPAETPAEAPAAPAMSPKTPAPPTRPGSQAPPSAPPPWLAR